MANKHRGEVDITLLGESWTLRPTFGAMCEIEDETEMAILELARVFQNGRFGGRHVTAVICAGLRAAYDDPPDYETVGGFVVKDGFHKHAGPVGEFLAILLSGEPQPKGDRKKREQKKKSRARRIPNSLPPPLHGDRVRRAQARAGRFPVDDDGRVPRGARRA